MHTNRRWLAAAVLVLGATGCRDLEITNPGMPDLARAFTSGAELEAHVAGTFQRWHAVQTGYFTPPMMLSAVSFQHSTANVCEAPYAELPRVAVENTQDAQCIESVRAWKQLYEILVMLRDGLKALELRPDLAADLEPASRTRLLAYSRFVQGVTHGSIALLYDRGVVVDERSDPTRPGALIGYDALMQAALAQLEEAAALSEAATWAPIPAEWMSVEVEPAQLARLARSWAARLRAGVARTPAQRAAVDWRAVRTDAEAGITEDWLMNMGPPGGTASWHATALWYLHHPTRLLTQGSYFILGMADQSGNYQRWLQQDPFFRSPAPVVDGVELPILIITPDTRFPRGATLAEQAASPGTMYALHDPGTRGWIRPERGRWRWSWYRYTGAEAYAGDVDWRWPAFTAAELRLLRAEAELRTGNAAAAAALVNVSRTAHGLRPASAAGTNEDCIPRLPDRSCGGLMEMLKWEKRLETVFRGAFLSSWYFDGRGWGDLHAGTFLQIPVPCSELTIIGEGCYTFGGMGRDWAAPQSIYRWPWELQP